MRLILIYMTRPTARIGESPMGQGVHRDGNYKFMSPPVDAGSFRFGAICVPPRGIPVSSSPPLLVTLRPFGAGFPYSRTFAPYGDGPNEYRNESSEARATVDGWMKRIKRIK